MIAMPRTSLLLALPLAVSLHAAIILPDYSLTATLSGARDLPCSGSCAADISSPMFGSYSLIGYGVSGAAVGFPGTFLEMSATADERDVVNGGIHLFFSIEAVGPATSSVPLNVDVKLSSGFDGNGVSATGAAGFQFVSYFPNIAATVICGQNPGCDHPTFDGTLHYNISPNFVYNVELFVAASASHASHLPACNAVPFGCIATLSAAATADPHFYIDPSFAGAKNYQIVLSDGIGNQLGAATTAPEPASSTLAAAALLAGALFLRRRNSRLKRVPER